MLDLKQAVKTAFTKTAEVFGDPTGSGRAEVSDIRLEEVEKSADDRIWKITVSFMRPKAAEASSGLLQIESMFPKMRERDYKLVEVDAMSGDVIAYRIRQLADS